MHLIWVEEFFPETRVPYYKLLFGQDNWVNCVFNCPGQLGVGDRASFKKMNIFFNKYSGFLKRMIFWMNILDFLKNEYLFWMNILDFYKMNNFLNKYFGFSLSASKMVVAKCLKLIWNHSGIISGTYFSPFLGVYYL